MANDPTQFLDADAIVARAAEVPNASFSNGMNAGGSCAPGIGIGTDVTNLEESLPNWTLLDQAGAARTPQDSQQIGGNGYNDYSANYPGSGGVEGPGTEPVFVIDPASQDGTGAGAALGNATLADLAAGWTAV